MQADTVLYNWAPTLQLLGLGLLLACVPLLWWWRKHRHALPQQQLKALTLLTLLLTFELVLIGAFTRLTDSGLGCPDWPGCYGSASPLGAHAQIEAAQTAMPTGPVTQGKAWMEMVHRYMASGVGVLIVVLALWTWRVWRRTPQQAVHPLWPGLTLAWVCLQGAFGAWTVTMKLFPAMVTAHLLLAVGLLMLLAFQAVRYGGWRSTAVPARTRTWLWAALLLLVLQIALGGWVSTNYAVLACTDFPTCQGQWWPQMSWQGFALWRELGFDAQGQLLPLSALTAIHFVHRNAAWLVLGVLCVAGLRLCQTPDLATQGRWVLAVSALQLLTGLSNIVLGWPLLAAVAHTAGAAALAVLLVWCLARSRCIGQSAPAPFVEPSKSDV